MSIKRAFPLLALFLALPLLLADLLPPGVHERRVFERIFDAGHFPLFFILTVVQASSGTLRRIATRTFLFAVAIETIQPWFNRSASLIDLANGACGIVVGVALLRARLSPRPTIAIASLALLSCGIFGTMLLPALRERQANIWHAARLPVLGAFDEEPELKFWTPADSGSAKGTTVRLEHTTFADHATVLAVERTPAGPIAVDYLADGQDWSAATALSFSVFADAPQPLYVRIDDDESCTEFSARFNRRIDLVSGWNDVRISLEDILHGPEHRLLDVRSIRRVAFFSLEAGTRRWLFDDVTLNPRS